MAAPYPDVRKLIGQIGQLLPNGALNGENWHLADIGSMLRLQTMTKASVTLREYIQECIYYGIKTGFNTAFVIDNVQRAKLITADPRSAEIIKPLAIGDDVRRWRIQPPDKWLIVTRIGVDIKRYPAILAHLSRWKADLQKRQDQGDNWWELRSCKYYSAFDQPKIVFPEIAKEPRFSFDASGLYTNNKAFIIPIDDLFLLGVLNSTPAWDYAKSICAALGDPDKGGRLMLQWVNFQRLPIPRSSAADRSAIAALIQQCLDVNSQELQILEVENEIDRRVARLYGLPEK